MRSSETNYSAPLTRVALDYRNNRMIAQEVIREVPVDDELFNFMKFAAAKAFTPVNDAADQDGTVPVVRSKSTPAEGRTIDRALREPVNNIAQHSGERRGFSQRVRTLKSIMETQDLNNELRTAAFMADDANFAAANVKTAGSGATAQPFPYIWTHTNATVIKDCQRIRDLLIVPEGSEVIGVCNREVWSAMSTATDVLEAVKYVGTGGGVAEVAPVAQKLGLATIVIADGRKHSGDMTDEESALDLSRVWGSDFWMVVRPVGKSAPDAEQPAFAYRFALNMKGGTRRVYEYEEQQRGGDGSWWVQVARNDVTMGVGKFFGAKIKSVLG